MPVQSGKDDWMGYWSIPRKQLPDVEERYAGPAAPLHVAEPLLLLHEHAGPPFDNVAVRQAVNYAISRKVLVDLAGGLAQKTENILPPGYPSFKEHKLYRHNLRKAKKLVRGVGRAREGA
jgi:ABC-type transport system substrate-binding protein